MCEEGSGLALVSQTSIKAERDGCRRNSFHHQSSSVVHARVNLSKLLLLFIGFFPPSLSLIKFENGEELYVVALL